MKKDVREFIRRLEAAGLEVEPTPGHYRVLRDGKPLRKANGMPSCCRSPPTRRGGAERRSSTYASSASTSKAPPSSLGVCVREKSKACRTLRQQRGASRRNPGRRDPARRDGRVPSRRPTPRRAGGASHAPTRFALTTPGLTSALAARALTGRPSRGIRPHSDRSTSRGGHGIRHLRSGSHRTPGRS